MRIALFVTCLNDTLFPRTGQAVVSLLRRLGHEVDFPMEQTCCGQMHLNTGYRHRCLPLVERLTRPERWGGRVEDACHLVIPSLPGFGYSAPPASLEGYTGAAIADLWAGVMSALGYPRFFASGGDVGARVAGASAHRGAGSR